MRNIPLAVIFCLFFGVTAVAQNNESLHITGVVLDAENLEPIPFTSVLIRDASTGTVADNSGYFSFFAQAGDTITFRSVGYQNRQFIIPRIKAGKTYSMIELMVRENLLLEEVIVYPLPEPSDFAQTLLKKKLSPYQQEQITSFRNDLDTILKEQTKENKAYYDQYRYAKLYDLTGIVPPNNFLNPITWSNFIRDWKENQKGR
ncbi:MAG: hypothetical protein ACJAT1_001523 [Marivirga sp.]|jgi:hypothetical protein